MSFRLVIPASEFLPGYLDALRRGWSADNLRGSAASDAESRRIGEDPEAFLASLDDPDARGPPVPLPDGTLAGRLPGFRRWMWDDGFCGSIGLRWSERGSAALPPHVPGHIGYAVVPWRRGKGYAARALLLLLPEARLLGLPWVDLTTSPDNVASQKAILAAGGRLIGPVPASDAHGRADAQRWRIDLTPT